MDADAQSIAPRPKAWLAAQPDMGQDRVASKRPAETGSRFGSVPQLYHEGRVAGVRIQRALTDRTDPFHGPCGTVKGTLLRPTISAFELLRLGRDRDVGALCHGAAGRGPPLQGSTRLHHALEDYPAMFGDIDTDLKIRLDIRINHTAGSKRPERINIMFYRAF